MEKIDQLPVTDTPLSNDEIRLILANNNLPVNRIYVSQVKSLLKKRQKIMKEMMDDKRQIAIDRALEEEMDADDLLPLMRPESFISKGASTAIELVSLKRNGQRGRQTSVLIEKLEQLTNRINELEKNASTTAANAPDEDKEDEDKQESDKEDKKEEDKQEDEDDDKTATPPPVQKTDSDDEKSE